MKFLAQPRDGVGQSLRGLPILETVPLNLSPKLPELLPMKPYGSLTQRSRQTLEAVSPPRSHRTQTCQARRSTFFLTYPFRRCAHDAENGSATRNTVIRPVRSAREGSERGDICNHGNTERIYKPKDFLGSTCEYWVWHPVFLF